MPIKYFRQKRKVAINSVSQDKYIAKIQVEAPVGFEDIAKMIEKSSTMSRGDLVGVFAQMEDIALSMALNGHPLHLGFFGNYYPSIEAEVVDTPEEVTIKTIKRFKLIYKPSVYMKKRLEKVKFVLGDNTVREVHYKNKK